MSIFCRKKSFIDACLPEVVVDRHSHILYGVDDGVKTQEDSLAILEWLEQQGLRELWLTPHIMEDVPNTTAALQARFAELLEVYGGRIRLHLAAEYMLDNNYVERLAAHDLLTMENQMVLCETSALNAPLNLHGMLEETMSEGYRPLLAHPERYRYMDMKDYERLHSMGILLQMNLPSLVGAYGPREAAKARELLSRGLYSAIGSDTHRFSAVRWFYKQKELRKADIEAIRRLAL